MTSYKSFFTTVLKASIAVVLLGSCTKRDPYLSNNGATFYVDTVTPTFTSDGLSSNNVVNRKFINFTACVKDNALQAAIMSLKFQIKAGDVSVVKTTDERGCLVWQEVFSYDGIDDEKQVLLTRSITGIEGHSGTEVVQLAYDPWDAADKMAFLKREAGASVEAAKIDYSVGGPVTRQDPETHLDYSVTVDIRSTLESNNLKHSDIVNLRLNDQGRDFSQYEIDPDLNLSIARKYEMNFNVGVIRTTFSKGTQAENITAGHFRAYLALLSEGYDAVKGMDSNIIQYIASANQVDVEANLGRIVQMTTLRFNNVAALSSRMTGVLTLVSTDTPNRFAETSFEGVLSPVTGGNLELDFIPSKNLNARMLLDLQTSFRNQMTRVSPRALFAQQTGFVELKTLAPLEATDQKILKGKSFFSSFVPADNDPKKFNIQEAFQTMRAGQPVSDQAAFGTALCYRYFGTFSKVPADVYAKCAQQPTKMITSVVRDLVVQVNNPIPTPVGAPIPETMTVSAGIDFSEAKTKAQGSTTTINGGVSLDMNAGVGLSWPPGGDTGPAPKGGGSAKSGLFKLIPFNIGGGINGKFSVGKDWYRTTGVVSSSDDTTKVGVSHGVTIVSDGFAFDLDVTTQSCFLIMPTDELEAALGTDPHPKGAFYCDPKNNPDTNRQEVYYFLNEAPDSSGAALADNFSSADVPWRMFIRGTSTFSIFETLFTQKGIKLTFEKLPDQALLNQFNTSFQTQEFPGMLVPQSPAAPKK